MKHSRFPRAHVRFSKQEYESILKDQLLAGKSIPWLLKTAYFKKRISPPTLDHETRKIVRRELSAIGNNLNQLARHSHMGQFHQLTPEILECIQHIKTMKSYLGLDYGNR